MHDRAGADDVSMAEVFLKVHLVGLGGSICSVSLSIAPLSVTLPCGGTFSLAQEVGSGGDLQVHRGVLLVIRSLSLRLAVLRCSGTGDSQYGAPLAVASTGGVGSSSEVLSEEEAENSRQSISSVRCHACESAFCSSTF